MARPVVASVAIGINGDAYEYDWTAGGPMQFAAADATRFDYYVRLAWPDAREERLILRLNRDANRQAIQDAFNSISGLGGADLLLVYLSGHGVDLGEAGAAFCTADGVPGEPGLTSRDLFELLNPCRAGSTLLFADCCFAHRVLGTCPYFGELTASRGRLYVASAMGGERSWEDFRLGHGVFSAVLMEALEKGLRYWPAGTDDPAHSTSLLVQRDLVPYLSECVPIAARAIRGVDQQPVYGGSALQDIVLPVAADGRGSRQPPTALQALTRQAYRLVRASLALAAAAIVLVQISTFHLKINGNGHVSVAEGTSALSMLWPTGWSERVDTGIPQTTLPSDPARLFELSSGSNKGVWTHKTSNGWRTWIDMLLPLLGDREAERWRTLLSGQVSGAQVTSTESYEDVQTWQLLDAADAARLSCGPTRRIGIESFLADVPQTSDVIDFRWLRLPTDDIAVLCQATVSYARVSSDHASRASMELSRLIAYRFEQHERGDAVDPAAELKCLAAVYPACAAATGSRPEQSIDGLLAWAREKKPVHALIGACGVTTLSKYLTSAEASEVREALLSIVKSFSSDRQGSAMDEAQTASLSALVTLARAHPLPDATFEQLDALMPEGSAFEKMPDLEMFLKHVAASQKLPKFLVSRLQDRIVHPKDEYDFFVLVAMSALAENCRFLDQQHRQALYSTIDQTGSKLFCGPNGIMPQYATVLGALGSNGIDVAEKIPALRLPLRSGWRPPVPSRDYTQTSTLIQWSDMPFAVALANIGRGCRLDDGLVEELWTIAALRPGAEGRNHLLEGLAAQSAKRDRVLDANTVRRNLAAYPQNAARRFVARDVLSIRIEMMSPAEQSALLNAVRVAWSHEQEPEVRRCLAELILAAGTASDD